MSCCQQTDEHSESETKRKVNWLPWTLAGILTLLLFYYVFDNGGAGRVVQFLPYLIFLACPLLMLFGHGHGHGHGHDHNQNHDEHPSLELEDGKQACGHCAPAQTPGAK